jgi:hypothetical protein
MYYLNCIHPPGGATALTAVAGGESVHALGFHYVVTPVLLNVLVILLVAVLFNLAFPWRRYPAVWARKPVPPAAPDDSPQTDAVFSREALTSAARAIDPAPGINKDHVETICTLALCNTDGSDSMHPADIRAGSYYCNGTFGPAWQVRRVIDCSDSETGESSTEEILSYRVVAGDKRRQTGIASREAFANWARYEVFLNENSWQRIDTTPRRVLTDNAA